MTIIKISAGRGAVECCMKNRKSKFQVESHTLDAYKCLDDFDDDLTRLHVLSNGNMARESTKYLINSNIIHRIRTTLHTSYGD